MGNLGSIANMVIKAGGRARASSAPDELAQARKIILPGVGHFDRGMEALRARGFIDVLRERVLGARVPVLGICLGMQLMCKSSEEGTEPGLGWIDAEVIGFDKQAKPELKIPHMGWNVVRATKPSSFFDESPAEPPRFYFVHSYYVRCNDRSDVLTETPYGGQFCSAFERDNIVGVQFHPEKSHVYGMEFVRRFLAV